MSRARAWGLAASLLGIAAGVACSDAAKLQSAPVAAMALTLALLSGLAGAAADRRMVGA